MKTYLYPGREDVYIDAYYPKDAKKPLPAVLICPGGGYFIVGTTEGRPVTDKFTDAGYASFILHYTVGEGAVFGPEGFKDFAPARDLGAAMRLLHDKADEFGIDPSQIVLIGFSAGGHLCAAWCFSGAFEESRYLPKALILSYPMGNNRGKESVFKSETEFDVAQMTYTSDPAVKKLPVFLWHAKDDDIVPFAASEALDERLTSEGIPHSFFISEHGVHARPFFDPKWFHEALDWLAAL